MLFTCRSHAWGNWCSWKSCRGTVLCSLPSQWHPGCSESYYLTDKKQNDEKTNVREQTAQVITRVDSALIPISSCTFHGDVDSWGQKQASKAIVEDLVALQCGCGMVSDLNTWIRKSLSLAPKGDANRCYLYPYRVDFKRSEPAAKPSKMRFLRSIGWLLVLISTPAWAFLKMSFSSSRPTKIKISGVKLWDMQLPNHGKIAFILICESIQ